MKFRFSTQFVSTTILLVATGLTGCDGAPADAPSSSKVAVPATSSQQWEYIVVSYGKTRFGLPDKTLAYRGLGLPEGQEGSDLQKSLDILGRFGWEVVSFIGQIGGDQQIVLKRRFERSRAADETEAISKNKDLYLRDLADILERQQRRMDEQARGEAAVGDKTALIELDAAERAAAIRDRMIKLQAATKAAFASSDLSKLGSITLNPITSYTTDLSIQLDIDLTSHFLKDGNSYRKSSVDAFMKEQAKAVRSISIPTDGKGNIEWKLTGSLTYQGMKKEVSSSGARYSSVLNSWW